VKQNAPIKLNIGSGPSSAKGWTNFDWGVLPLLSKFPFVRRVAIRVGILSPGYDIAWPKIQLVDIRKHLPLADDSASHIYCSHVLEHLERWQALRLLNECRRILRPHGKIRIVVPDLEIICRDYLATRTRSDSNMKEVVRPGEAAARLIWGHPKDVTPRSTLDLWSRKFIRGHEWTYDDQEMKILLEEAGFADVVKSAFRSGDFPDLDPLELESHAPHSLYMEGTRL
jgi:SAM-dependent methyltransferase